MIATKKLSHICLTSVLSAGLLFSPIHFAYAGFFGSSLSASSPEDFAKTWAKTYNDAPSDKKEILKKAIVRIAFPREMFDEIEVFSDSFNISHTDTSFEDSLKKFDIKFLGLLIADEGDNGKLVDGKSVNDLIANYGRTEKTYLEQVLPVYKERLKTYEANFGIGEKSVTKDEASPSAETLANTGLSHYTLSDASFGVDRNKGSVPLFKYRITNHGGEKIGSVKIRFMFFSGSADPKTDDVFEQDIPGGLSAGQSKDLTYDMSTIYYVNFKIKAMGKGIPDMIPYRWEAKIEDAYTYGTNEHSVATQSQFDKIKKDTAISFAKNQAAFDHAVSQIDKASFLKETALAFLKFNADATEINAQGGVQISGVATAQEVAEIKDTLIKHGVLKEEDFK